MDRVTPKKKLGQHFLKDKNIASKIVESLRQGKSLQVLEIGPGMGVLTEFLLQLPAKLFVIEIDRESVDYLNTNFPQLKDRVILGDFLNFEIDKTFKCPFAIIGNFPYNISSQIFFKILENRNLVVETVCMLQKEVAERIACKPGSKAYGILSVFLQAFYQIEYLFTVNEDVFYPPPKVKSGVIRLTRNETVALSCNEKLFFKVVKTAFNQRRKTLRNSLKSMLNGQIVDAPIFSLRPEQLNVEQFIELTNLINSFQ